MTVLSVFWQKKDLGPSGVNNKTHPLDTFGPQVLHGLNFVRPAWFLSVAPTASVNTQIWDVWSKMQINFKTYCTANINTRTTHNLKCHRRYIRNCNTGSSEPHQLRMALRMSNEMKQSRPRGVLSKFQLITNDRRTASTIESLNPASYIHERKYKIEQKILKHRPLSYSRSWTSWQTPKKKNISTIISKQSLPHKTPSSQCTLVLWLTIPSYI
jgi:hypothetical protein